VQKAIASGDKPAIKTLKTKLRKLKKKVAKAKKAVRCAMY
jgi:capsule polysaccharide export protein KpsE/RkpR